jgi:hypothetical protein
MNSKSFFPTTRARIVGLMLGLAAIAALVFGMARTYRAPEKPSTEPILARNATNQVAVPSVNTTNIAAEVRAEAVAGFQVRPFAVSLERGDLQWTAEDGRDTNVIRRLAHNELEYQRMVEENARIKRRQLVYRKDTAAGMVQRARSVGETVHRLTLPALDGQEVQFEITKAELNPSGQQGTFSGRLAGRPDSMVTLAFKGGREAFTILSPTEGLFLQADPRESGEVIVKSIDPATYVAGVCGTP